MYRVKVRVQELCQERNWSLYKLSVISGVEYGNIRRYSKQPMDKLSMDAMCRIKETFGCSWEELLEIQGDNSFDD